MKRLVMGFVLAGVLVSAGALSGQTEAPSDNAYAEGVRAVQCGDMAAARHLFERILADDPDHRAARAQLQALAQNEAAAGGMRRKLEATVIPVIDFDDTALDAAIDFLAQASAKHSADGQELNFVRLYPREYGTESRVTLRLRDIPLDEALRYVGEMAAVRFVPDQYAIRVSPAATENGDQ